MQSVWKAISRVFWARKGKQKGKRSAEESENPWNHCNSRGFLLSCVDKKDVGLFVLSLFHQYDKFKTEFSFGVFSLDTKLHVNKSSRFE